MQCWEVCVWGCLGCQNEWGCLAVPRGWRLSQIESQQYPIELWGCSELFPILYCVGWPL